MKSSLTRIIINGVFFFVSVALELNAQQIISKQIVLSDQLSSIESTDIYQDKQGFIWIGTYNGIVRYDGYDIRIFRNNYKEPKLLKSNTISCFTEDEQYLWVGTGKGINLIDKKTLQITPFSEPAVDKVDMRCLLTDSKGTIWIGSESGLFRYINGTLEHKRPTIGGEFYANSIYEDHLDNIWILCWQGGLFKYDPEKDEFIAFPRIGRANNPFRMYQDNAGRYWIATWGDGLWRFDPHATPENMYIQQSPIHSRWHQTEGVLYDIIQDDIYGYIWTLSYSGLRTFRINANNMLEEIHIRDFEYQPNSIEFVKAYTRIIKDRDGYLWLNSHDKVCAIFFNEEKITNYNLPNMSDEIGLIPNITSLGKDDKDVVWFNQTWYGLCLYNEKTGQLAYGQRMNTGMSIRYAIPSRVDRTMWLSDAHARKVWNMKQENMKTSILEEIDLGTIVSSPKRITRLLEDKQGNLWIGSENELFVRKRNEDRKIIVVDSVTNVTDITEDKQGNIWISTQKDIRKIANDNINRTVRLYSQQFIGPDDKIESLCAGNNSIWFATSMGRIFKIDRNTSAITDQFDSCALDGENILRLLSQDDDIWIVQSRRIIRHTPSGNNHLYNISDDNIYLSSFRYGDAFIDNGKLYASGTEGYITIELTNEPIRAAHHKVLITDIRMDGISLLSVVSSGKKPASVEELTLPPDARNIEIDFSALNYSLSGRVEYAYRLEGEDNRWTYLSNGKHTAFFNRLNKGKYTFLVKSRSSGSEWSEEITRINITRLPALYETWYAQLLYVIIGMLLVFILLRIYLKRENQKNRVRFQEELTQAKLNYFTNISHELLTPLTVISCVADDMEENVDNSGRQVGILRINVGRLKRLLVQILDFRKIESNNMPLQVTHGNVSAFMAGVTASNFEYLAQQKNIRFTTHIAGDIWGYIDFEKLDKILFNLLSNAIKYTPENKKVDLSAYTILKEDINTLVVEVADEGIGIDPKNIRNIFTKFYNNREQVGYESNGIGLSLTKDLIGLHYGTINVKSEPNKGSVFTVELPLDKNVYSKPEIAESDISEPIQIEPDNFESKPCILYVEDNKDLRELMKTVLHHKYQILLAENGEKGLEVVNSNMVDIIICDLMMPRMDGLEFCRRIKGNIQTSHIPVLMLTAKNTPEDQVECYKAGVESFITKPFDKNILNARITNLLIAREARQRSFQTNMDINISNLDYQTADEQFLNDAIACIENHLDDSEFDIPKMADVLHVSKSTLGRKLKVITDLTPGDFVRNIKLKHACSLLKKRSITISEVAYATGFSNPKYFSKCFKDEFGMTPTEYVEEYALK